MRIEHSCGHATAANIYGTDVHGERQRKADWLATRPCPTCARTQRQQEHEERNTEATATAEANNWPTLTGSDKQIAWAQTLRADAIAAMHDRLTARFNEDNAAPVLALWTAAAVRQTNAAWWIDNRDRILPAINSLTLTADERKTLTDMTGGNR